MGPQASLAQLNLGIKHFVEVLDASDSSDPETTIGPRALIICECCGSSQANKLQINVSD